MSTKTETYTYRCGEKIPLKKNDNQFVVRAMPNRLQTMGLSELEQVSSASTRITTTQQTLEANMAVCRGLAPTHHAYELSDSGESFLITDRIFVRFKSAVNNQSLSDFIARYALVPKQKYNSQSYLFELTDQTGMNPVKLVVLLTEKEDLVASAGHDVNYTVKKYNDLVPQDPQYLKQWHLHERLSDNEFDPRASSHCEDAWNILGNYGDPDVVIGITDDGCLLSHVDFDSTNKFANWGYFEGEALFNKNSIEAEERDMYTRGANHGTSCAGVAAGEADAEKTVGAAPACHLLPIKWESSGPRVFISDSKLVTALEFMADKVDIMSNSWGSSPIGIWEQQVLDTIQNLSENGGRRGKGIVFMWAAGNENCPIEHTSTLDIPFTPGVSVRPDGSLAWIGVRTARFFRHNLVDLPGVMHIAALASTAQRSHYSNHGTGISLCAPSSNLHTYYRLMLDGLGVTTTTGPGSNVTDFFGGTSSATPLVAGIAALVISANPNLSAAEVIQLLKRTASKDLNFEGYPRTPSSSFDSDTSWDISPVPPFDDGAFQDIDSEDGTWSPWFGHGKADAAEAVKAAIALLGEDSSDIFKASATPAMSIPDNDEDGVQNIISCSDVGTVKNIKVTVNITHTFIGDLIVALQTPSGKEVILHNRRGGTTNNLNSTFDVTNTSALTQFTGEAINGDWTLKVIDNATIDTGTLDSWELEIGIDRSEDIVAEKQEGMLIPDNDKTGIEGEIVITDSGIIEDAEVSLDITHTYIGDLKVELINPQNDSMMLHKRKGGSRDNIIRSFSMVDTPILAVMKGKSVTGTWRLKVIDRAARDRGKLNHWKLKFRVR